MTSDELEEKSFKDSLSELVLLCSRKRATDWREIWDQWTYSQTVEFALQLITKRQERDAQLQDFKDPTAILIALMMDD